MEKSRIQQIGKFLTDVYEGGCGGDEPVTMRLQLTELYRVIKELMDETFKTKDQQLKVLLATLEKRAREYKDELEKRLGARN